MKKQIAIASAILAASSYSFAEIALTESLSVEGFVDMSYTDSDSGDSRLGLDQVEFDFLFDNGGAVTAQVDVQFLGDNDADTPDGPDGTNDDNTIEQAFISYDLGGSGTISVGRMASTLGFEDFEPTGLYQYSNAVSTRALPGYATGIRYSTNGLNLSVSEGISGFQDGAIADGDGYFLEASYSLELTEGLNAFVGALLGQDSDDDADSQVINAYLTYETGAWLFAAEVVKADFDQNSILAAGAEVDVTDYQVMANYSYSDKASVTARYAVSEDDEAAITLAHNLALADNLALVAEVTRINPDNEALDNETECAVELLFTF